MEYNIGLINFDSVVSSRVVSQQSWIGGRRGAIPKSEVGHVIGSSETD